MLTTILAYVIAFMGLVMIGGGVWGLFYVGQRHGSGSTEILRNGNRNDLWRSCHGWPCHRLCACNQ